MQLEIVGVLCCVRLVVVARANVDQLSSWQYGCLLPVRKPRSQPNTNDSTISPTTQPLENEFEKIITGWVNMQLHKTNTKKQKHATYNKPIEVDTMSCTHTGMEPR